MHRDLNSVDAALWQRAKALLAARLAEQRAAGLLEEMPAGGDEAWRSHKPPTIHKSAQLLDDCSVLAHPCTRRAALHWLFVNSGLVACRENCYWVLHA